MTTPDYLRLMQKMADVVAHEVRNPLNNILLSTAHFKMNTPPNKDDTAFFVDIIERNCERINTILADMITMIHDQGLTLDTYDLAGLIKEVMDENAAYFELKKVQCKAAPGEEVMARFDRAKMKVVLEHVLQNALDAMGNGGTLFVRVEKGDEIRLEIRDSGEGISSEALPHIFVPFYTTRDRHKGLGLALAKNIMDAHKGRIAVDTGTGGSCFTLCLPVN